MPQNTMFFHRASMFGRRAFLRAGRASMRDRITPFLSAGKENAGQERESS
jgi:hypothetical protein